MPNDTKIDLPCYTSQSDACLRNQFRVLNILLTFFKKLIGHLLNLPSRGLPGSLRLESWNHTPARSVWQWGVGPGSQPWYAPELRSHTWARPHLTWGKTMRNKLLVWGSDSRTFQVPFLWGNESQWSRQIGKKEWLISHTPLPELWASPQPYLILRKSEPKRPISPNAPSFWVFLTQDWKSQVSKKCFTSRENLCDCWKQVKWCKGGGIFEKAI